MAEEVKVRMERIRQDILTGLNLCDHVKNGGAVATTSYYGRESACIECGRKYGTHALILAGYPNIGGRDGE